MEGLWVVQFLEPSDPTMDLNGGVVVIETGRILGGDSGYFYLGQIGNQQNGTWPITLTITRHDPNIVSIFGDIDQFALEGTFVRQEQDDKGRPVMIADLMDMPSQAKLVVQLTRVSLLP